MIHGSILQCFERRGARYPISFHDRLWMDPHPDKLFRLPKQLRRKDSDARCPIPNLVILHLGDVNENLGSGVVELDRLEDRRTVVRHVDIAGRHRLQNFVHPFGTQRAFDEVAEREGTHEGGQARVLCLLLGCLKMKMSAKKLVKNDTPSYTSSLKMFTDIVEC
jgi:hypothetical protein